MKKKIKQIKTNVKALISKLNENKIQTLHTALLIWLVIRVEQLHALFHLACDLLSQGLTAIFMNIISARAEFGAAIDSILTLFGGDGA
jgi:phage-related protein